MCSYIVEKTALVGSAKGRKGWMRIDTANVYFDHLHHSTPDHVEHGHNALYFKYLV